MIENHPITDEELAAWTTAGYAASTDKPALAIHSAENGKDTVTTGTPARPAPGRRSPPRPPANLDSYRPFPVEALPAPLTRYVRQGADALGCDAAYLALPVLAVAASAIGNTRTIRLKRGWDEPSVVWSAIIGDSGTLKSPAYLKAVGCLFARQKQLVLSYRKLVAASRQEAKGKGKGADRGSAADAPALERVVCSDTTIEKLAQVLEDNARGVLVARDELAGWLGSFTRYKGKGGGSDLPAWLEMHRAGTVVVDRKTGDQPTLFIERAAVSVTGGIQPGVLARALTADFLEAGGAARLLLAMPPKLPKLWSEVEIAPDVEQSYEDAISKLLTIEFNQNGDGDDVPHALRLSPEAKAAWVGFYNTWGKEQANAEGELAAAFAKLEGYAARFTLIHHVVTHVCLDVDDRCEVGVRSVQAGVILCRWFAAEARRIYATLSESQEQRDCRRLVEFVRSRGGSITARDLQRSNNRKYPTVEDAEAALNVLEQAGLGGWGKSRTTARGGRPTQSFILCTTHDKTDGTIAEDDTSPSRVPDETPDGTYGTAAKSQDADGSVGFVMRRAEVETPGARGEMPEGGSVGRNGVLSDRGDAWEGD